MIVSDLELIEALKAVLVGDTLEPEKLPKSLAVVILNALSTLNGNAQNGRCTAKWLLNRANVECNEDATDYDGNLDEFIRITTAVSDEVSRALKGALTKDFDALAKGYNQGGERSAPKWLDRDAADARFMPGNGKRIVPRVIAAFSVMHLFREQNIKTQRDLLERFPDASEPVLKKDELAKILEKISGFTIEVGLQQILRQAGHPDAMKFDRRLEAAIPRALGLPINRQESLELFRRIAPNIPDKDGQAMTPAQLDHALWKWGETK